MRRRSRFGPGVPLSQHTGPHLIVQLKPAWRADLTAGGFVHGRAFAAGEGRQVAITIDDLPRGGDSGADEYAGRNGFSWIHRWSKTRDLAPQGEPDPPEWVMEAFENQR